jgi:hypothetical protein
MSLKSFLTNASSAATVSIALSNVTGASLPKLVLVFLTIQFK